MFLFLITLNFKMMANLKQGYWNWYTVSVQLGYVVPSQHASTMQRETPKWKTKQKQLWLSDSKLSRLNLKNLTGAFVVLLVGLSPFPIDIPLRNNWLKIEPEVTGRHCRYECRDDENVPQIKSNITHINPTKWTRCKISQNI